jgi:SAM-dependent methyltransferase
VPLGNEESNQSCDSDRVSATKRLLGDAELERSSVVANCRMNRERNLLGTNGYDRELRFNPLEFLKRRIATGHHVAWLDLCCGNGRALIQAAHQVRAEGLVSSIEIVGVDLVGMFDPTDSSLSCLRLEEASLSTWRPDRSFDLITCVHGLHYVGDKIGLIAGAASWLVEDGLFVANLDLNNICLSDGKTKRTLAAQLRGSGLEYDRRKRLIVCRGSKRQTLPFRYLGSNDRVGPNYTGQPAVTSHYEYLSTGIGSARFRSR